jgi:hypothetical protein
VADGVRELTMEEARSLTSKHPFASEEFLLSDDPMQNLTTLATETGDAGGQLYLGSTLFSHSNEGIQSGL